MFKIFTSFLAVGAIGTLAHYTTLMVLVESFVFDPVIASGCGAFLGLLVNYGLNYRLTFNSNQAHIRTFPKFALIAGLGLLINFAVMTILTQELYYLYAQVVTTLIVLFWNFSANTLWTFKADA